MNRTPLSIWSTKPAICERQHAGKLWRESAKREGNDGPSELIRQPPHGTHETYPRQHFPERAIRQLERKTMPYPRNCPHLFPYMLIQHEVENWFLVNKVCELNQPGQNENSCINMQIHIITNAHVSKHSTIWPSMPYKIECILWSNLN